MNDILSFLTSHAYLVVFTWVFAEQIGLPIPSSVVLLTAGAGAALGSVSLPGTVLAALVASTVADVIWYEAGRRKGMTVLGLLCRVSLEPDSCVRRTEERFGRHGARSLLIAKFVPGLNTAAPPLAGMFRMGFWRFLLFDVLGGLLWIGASVLSGFVFARQLEELLLWARQFGLGLGILLGLAVAAWIGWKYWQRRSFIRQLQVSGISPEELKGRLDAGHPTYIVDLRHPVEFSANPVRLPGAVRLSPAELEEGRGKLPKGHEIVLYCT